MFELGIEGPGVVDVDHGSFEDNVCGPGGGSDAVSSSGWWGSLVGTVLSWLEEGVMPLPVPLICAGTDEKKKLERDFLEYCSNFYKM